MATTEANQQETSLSRSRSDSEVGGSQIQKSKSMRRMFVEDISCDDGSAGDRVWAVISSADGEVSVVVETQTSAVAVLDLTRKDNLLMFTLPEVEDESEPTQITFSMSNENQTSVPFTYKPRPQNVQLQESAEIHGLMEFAARGDVISIVTPYARHLHSKDSEGNSVLHIAANNSQSFALKVFLSVVPLSQKDELLNAGNERGLTALHCAVRTGDPDAVHYLMNHGALTNIPDGQGNTAVHYLADGYNESIFKEILEPARGQETRFDTMNRDGYCPLHLAVKRLKFSLLEMMLESGADVNQPDVNRRTSLMHAVVSGDKNADPNIEDNASETALSLVYNLKNWPVLGLLLDSGADASKSTGKGFCLTDVEDSVVQAILAGERPELPKKESNHGNMPTDLTTSRTPLFGSGRSTEVREDEQVTRVVRKSRDEIINEAETLLNEPMPPRAAVLEEYDDYDDEPGPSTSTRHEARNARLKDDVSNLDYLTRLRLSKLLDDQGKWQQLAQSLGCEHMIELIEICSCGDSNESSPTMIFLDQFEQLPDATISRLRECLSNLCLEDAVALVDKRFVY